MDFLLHHASVGVTDMDKARSFYDPVMEALGCTPIMAFDFATAYGRKYPEFWVTFPHDQKPATAGNGTHICFAAKDQAMVDAFHAAAMTQGGTDNGAPSIRAEYSPNYYGAFVIDPFGNKIEACHMPVDDPVHSA